MLEAIRNTETNAGRLSRAARMHAGVRMEDSRHFLGRRVPRFPRIAILRSEAS
jgi:hypothetical protein